MERYPHGVFVLFRDAMRIIKRLEKRLRHVEGRLTERGWAMCALCWADVGKHEPDCPLVDWRHERRRTGYKGKVNFAILPAGEAFEDGRHALAYNRDEDLVQRIDELQERRKDATGRHASKAELIREALWMLVEKEVGRDGE